MTSHAAAVNRSFTSDNVMGASPEIIRAIAELCVGPSPAYGSDEITRRVERKLSDIFERDVHMLLVPTGTAANGLSLSVLCPPWGAILAHPEAHLHNDECGAPEFFTAGAKILPVSGEQAKIDPSLLADALRWRVGNVGSVQPSAVSITQATELGTVYTVEQVGQIGALCRSAGVRLHMDGARFANALAFLGCTPADMTWKAGVDALSFGATKNGTLCAEAIVLFNADQARELAFRRKRGGHTLSKMRLLAAQLDAYLANDLWLRNASHANQMAAHLADGLRAVSACELTSPVQANILFCRISPSIVDALEQAGFSFYHGLWGEGVVRFVTSYATTMSDVDALIGALKRLETR